MTISVESIKKVSRELLKNFNDRTEVSEATGFGTESGMRFLYCACAVSYMLNDWSGVDMDMAKDYMQCTA